MGTILNTFNDDEIFWAHIWAQENQARRAKESGDKLGRVVETYTNIMDLKGADSSQRPPVSLPSLHPYLLLCVHSPRPGLRAQEVHALHAAHHRDRPVRSLPVLSGFQAVLIVVRTSAARRKYYPERMGRLYIVNAPWSVF